jgi:CubicO group peptidase (beta-lactamase class C family)
MKKYVNHLANLESINAFSLVIIYGDQKITHGNGFEKRYAIRSMSKAFGSYLLQTLVDKKLCKWGDKVSSYYKIKSDMTLQDLVEHNVAYKPHLFTQMIDYGYDVKKIKQNLETEEENGEKGFNYNNIFYAILDDIIETISKQSASLLFQSLMDQIGMKETGFTDDAMKGYYLDDLCCIKSVNLIRSVSNFGFSGGIVTTIDDMEKWMKFMFDKTDFLKIDREYGKGWWTADENQITRAHCGSVTGFSSAILMIPENKFGICCLCNMTNANFSQRVINKTVRDIFGLELFDMMAPLKNRLSVRTVPLNGCYKNDLFGKIIIDGNKFNCGNVTGRLIYVKSDECVVVWSGPESVYYTEDRIRKIDDNKIELQFYDFYPKPMICDK